MKNHNIHANLRYIGVVAKKGASVSRVREVIRSRGLMPLCADEVALDEIVALTPLIVSLGGDGTLLGLTRIYRDQIYIIGVFSGTLGFLTDINLDEFDEFLDEFLGGRYEILRPNMLEIRLRKGETHEVKFAFNDVVITRTNIVSMANIDAFLDGKFFNHYNGDGVMISSPAGSTAYNMSAGGSILFPDAKAFCVTPICSHSLTQRPIILPRGKFISFANASRHRLSLVIDGQESHAMSEFDEVCVGLSDVQTNLIKRADYDFFDVLRTKLRWGD